MSNVRGCTPGSLPQVETAGITDDAIALARIPAPTFAERARGEWVLERLQQLHLDEIGRAHV